ncbi:hypothetical protein SAMN06296036_118114 [Pseudobacteriovorax antillogorgiicola]|uniref:Uncharacterized protein n=1 Tax=Pseudobacteriovorax antillogorgiicola TaxID=1513793 RepID=A0A1Y6CDH8_9BACT|nr:hypothetical protein EDD56_11827 [Pseudobacteriovorax antillogorgiicola]SMF57259.1 hypothetical protein SAMN06296036_118114 [Pseudobacteriovorax antillogorgiicola]
MTKQINTKRCESNLKVTCTPQYRVKYGYYECKTRLLEMLWQNSPERQVIHFWLDHFVLVIYIRGVRFAFYEILRNRNYTVFLREGLGWRPASSQGR